MILGTVNKDYAQEIVRADVLVKKASFGEMMEAASERKIVLRSTTNENDVRVLGVRSSIHPNQNQVPNTIEVAFH